MRRLNIKAILSIIIISIVITVSFLFVSYKFYEHSMDQVLDKNSISENAYLVNRTDLVNTRYSGVSSFHQMKDIRNAQNSFVISWLPLIVIGTFTTIVIAVLLFWYVSRYFYYREIRKVIAQLENVSDGELTYDGDPILKEALTEVKDKFEKNLEDYKRLHSYLSHDQKNTLSILRAESELMDNKKTLEWIDNLSSNIDNLLALSDTKVDNDLIEVDVALVVASVCDQYRKVYSAISFDFDETEESIIMGKERWLYRAISNLVDNAIKYGNDKPIKLKAYSQNDFVIIEVKDDGIGMSKEYVDKVFDTYYRVNDFKNDGYGIGLSIVSHVCDLCNGTIWVESEIDKGTCFYLSFPKV